MAPSSQVLAGMDPEQAATAFEAGLLARLAGETDGGDSGVLTEVSQPREPLLASTVATKAVSSSAQGLEMERQAAGLDAKSLPERRSGDVAQRLTLVPNSQPRNQLSEEVSRSDRFGPLGSPGGVQADGGALPVRNASHLGGAPLHPVPAAEAGTSNPFIISPSALAGDSLLQETSKHLRSIGAVNILVAGQTGVGKSTLINSVFGEAFAKTSAGEPVTQQAEWYVSDTVPLRILDTRGLEAKDYLVTLTAMRAEIENSRAQKDERSQLHMGWVCISAPSSRVQACEIDIIRVLNKFDIPAIVILTKYDDDDDFIQVVTDIMTQRNAHITTIVPVRALSKPSRPSTGLADLVTATYTALPAAHKAAFAAAQKINRDLNKSTADDYVTVAASAAAAASAIPIPFADMVTLAPIQASMLVGVSNAFGLSLERPQIMQLITTVLGCLAVTLAGGWAVGSVLKFIPGPGSIIGAVLNASIAGALTRALGKAYIRFLYSFLEAHGRLPSAEEIFDLFPTFYKAGLKG